MRSEGESNSNSWSWRARGRAGEMWENEQLSTCWASREAVVSGESRCSDSEQLGELQEFITYGVGVLEDLV